MIELLNKQLENKSKRRIAKELGLDIDTINSILDGKNTKEKYKLAIKQKYGTRVPVLDTIGVASCNLDKFLSQDFEVLSKKFDTENNFWQVEIKYIEN